VDGTGGAKPRLFLWHHTRCEQNTEWLKAQRKMPWCVYLTLDLFIKLARGQASNEHIQKESELRFCSTQIWSALIDGERAAISPTTDE
jgi:hypothetical protein